MSAMCIGLHNYTLWYGYGMVYDKDGDCVYGNGATAYPDCMMCTMGRGSNPFRVEVYGVMVYGIRR